MLNSLDDSDFSVDSDSHNGNISVEGNVSVSFEYMYV